MITSTSQVRVRYSETDKMGYVYYGHYAQYYEVARVEMLRGLGFSYFELEQSGILMPVLDFSIRFLKPAFYDDLLTVKTVISKIPTTRIGFHYETYNQNSELLNQGLTTLVFINKSNGKPRIVPPELVSILKSQGLTE
jgi:acyl-CoA thioester hydrolase